MNKKFVLGMLALVLVSVNVFGQNANQVIRDLTALAEGVNDYRDDVGVLTFNITDKTMAKAINIIQKFVNNGLRSQKWTIPCFFLGTQGRRARKNAQESKTVMGRPFMEGKYDLQQ